ncbi:hypothetical protein DFP72DRAFT_854889 [Ephemerocybe angulata]|uniref:Uncharacterized protein n=1 Tax=Ephemerocybe angulata TaxID=980116 RepID=A0A8H6HI63_9AGAR|nr:hypothetical protein DFP72DRAFT_854889 [Tulosesus angulatus]
MKDVRALKDHEARVMTIESRCCYDVEWFHPAIAYRSPRRGCIGVSRYAEPKPLLDGEVTMGSEAWRECVMGARRTRRQSSKNPRRYDLSGKAKVEGGKAHSRTSGDNRAPAQGTMKWCATESVGGFAQSQSPARRIGWLRRALINIDNEPPTTFVKFGDTRRRGAGSKVNLKRQKALGSRSKYSRSPYLRIPFPLHLSIAVPTVERKPRLMSGTTSGSVGRQECTRQRERYRGMTQSTVHHGGHLAGIKRIADIERAQRSNRRLDEEGGDRCPGRNEERSHAGELLDNIDKTSDRGGEA